MTTAQLPFQARVWENTNIVMNRIPFHNSQFQTSLCLVGRNPFILKHACSSLEKSSEAVSLYSISLLLESMGMHYCLLYMAHT